MSETKIVIKVYMDGKRCLPKAIKVVIMMLKQIMPYEIIWKKNTSTTKLRKKAMKIAVACPGVASVAFVAEKSQLVVTGVGVDAVCLTYLIRQNVGFAEILTLGPN